MRRAIAIASDRPDTYITGVEIHLSWDGATDRARRLLDSAPGLGATDIEVDYVWPDLYDGRPQSAVASLEASSRDVNSDQDMWHPEHCWSVWFFPN